jgi:hypothetical protein
VDWPRPEPIDGTTPRTTTRRDDPVESKTQLQRSRKFLLLVKTFGEDILHAVPEVSVTRLDPVKLEDLTKLATGSVEANKIEKLLARMTP